MAWRTTSWWKRCYEGLRGARVVSPFLRVFTGRFCVCWVRVAFVCFVCFVRFLLVLLVKTPAFNSRFTFFCEFLVVDRPCPVLDRQCRKKKITTMASIKISSVEVRTWLHAGRLEELLILNRPCRPGEDVKDSVLHKSHWQA